MCGILYAPRGTVLKKVILRIAFQKVRIILRIASQKFSRNPYIHFFRGMGFTENQHFLKAITLIMLNIKNRSNVELGLALLVQQ